MICKDVLQHLPYKDFFKFLQVTDKFKYVLAANGFVTGMQKNIDIEMGEYRPLDLRLSPFNVRAEFVYVINR